MDQMIEIKTDISDCEMYFKNAFNGFDILESTFSEIEAYLSDTTKWAGESHDKCVEIQLLVIQYEAAIRLIEDELQHSISKLAEYSGDFVANSTLLQKIKVW